MEAYRDTPRPPRNNQIYLRFHTGFIISSFRMALFRLYLFSHGVLSSFRMASFRLVKVCGRTGYRTRDLWLLSQTGYRLR